MRSALDGNAWAATIAGAASNNAIAFPMAPRTHLSVIVLTLATDHTRYESHSDAEGRWT